MRIRSHLILIRMQPEAACDLTAAFICELFLIFVCSIQNLILDWMTANIGGLDASNILTLVAYQELRIFWQ